MKQVSIMAFRTFSHDVRFHNIKNATMLTLRDVSTAFKIVRNCYFLTTQVQDLLIFVTDNGGPSERSLQPGSFCCRETYWEILITFAKMPGYINIMGQLEVGENEHFIKIYRWKWRYSSFTKNLSKLQS